MMYILGTAGVKTRQVRLNRPAWYYYKERFTAWDKLCIFSRSVSLFIGLPVFFLKFMQTCMQLIFILWLRHYNKMCLNVLFESSHVYSTAYIKMYMGTILLTKYFEQMPRGKKAQQFSFRLLIMVT